MQINKFKQYFLTPTCLKCGSYFCEESLFCEICFSQEIAKRMDSPMESHVVNAQHFYLLNWYRFDNEILSQLVYRLKSDNSWPALGYYAKLLVPKVKIDWQNYAGLIPIPGSKSGSVHAKLLAQEISYITGLPVIDVLIKKNGATEQKLKSAFERKNESSISVKKGYAEQFTKCIFVDDILTTGETFFQSNRAVKGCNENVIVTLFYRPKA